MNNDIQNEKLQFTVSNRDRKDEISEKGERSALAHFRNLLRDSHGKATADNPGLVHIQCHGNMLGNGKSEEKKVYVYDNANGWRHIATERRATLRRPKT